MNAFCSVLLGTKEVHSMRRGSNEIFKESVC